MKTVEEFKVYCKKSVKCRFAEEASIIWNLSNGDEIYFKKGFKKPHIISPEPFVDSKYGDFGYEGTLEWKIAFDMLTADGAFEEV